MKSKFNKVIMLIALCALAINASATRRYVKPTASGSGSGNSWANASGNLQSVINASTHGDTIWVAQGTYKPVSRFPASLISLSNYDPDDVKNYYFYVRNGVRIYGGFVGNETSHTARNPAANPTIISGDINVVGDTTDNTYHLMLVNSDSAVTIDGFTFTKSNGSSDYGLQINLTDGSTMGSGEGASIGLMKGSGHKIISNKFNQNGCLYKNSSIYNIAANTTIRNNTFDSEYTNNDVNNNYNYVYTNKNLLIDSNIFTNIAVDQDRPTKVLVGSSTYSFDSVLTLTMSNNTIQNVTIGQGSFTCLSHTPSNNYDTAIFINNTVNNLIVIDTINGSYNFVSNYGTGLVKNLNYQNLPKSNNYLFQSSQRLIIDSIAIENSRVDYLISMNYSTVEHNDFIIKNSKFKNLEIAYTGISFLNVYNIKNAIIDRCSFDSFNLSNYLFGIGGNNVSLTNNNFSNIEVPTIGGIGYIGAFDSLFFSNNIIRNNNQNQSTSFGSMNLAGRHKQIDNNYFYSNSSNGQLMIANGYDTTDIIKMNNNVFYNNNFVNSDNSTLIHMVSPDTADFYNNTFVNNSAYTSANGLVLSFNSDTSTGVINIKNNIFYGNTIDGADNIPGTEYEFYETDNKTVNLYNNMMQIVPTASDVNSPITNGGDNIGLENPGFYNIADIDGTDNILGNADDGLNLKICSPAYNTGTNDGITAGAKDVTDTARILYNTVDRGAYESIVDTLSINPVITDVLCHGESTGSIVALVNGGVAPYSYVWDEDTSTASSITDLPASTHDFQVIDYYGCASVMYSETILQPDAPLLAVYDSAKSVSCYGGSDGEAYITVSGGTAPYTYSWSNGATTQDLIGAPADTFTVTVTDANNCTFDLEIVVTQYPQLVLNIDSLTFFNATCYGASDGVISLFTYGGRGSYTYTWSSIEGNTNESYALPANDYTVTVTDSNNCTSSVSFTITQPDLITGTQVASICEGQTYPFNGIDYSASNNTATDTLDAANGCDSIVTLNLTVLPRTYSTLTHTMCEGSSFTFNGVEYTESNNTATDTLVNANGCDSIIMLDLVVNPITYGTLNVSICEGSSYEFNGVVYSASTDVPTDTFVNANGCDSILNLKLTVNDYLYGTRDVSICYGQSYSFNGIEYTSANNTATDTIPNATGCDSIITLNLTIDGDGSIVYNPASDITMVNDDTVNLYNNVCKIFAKIVTTENLGMVSGAVDVLPTAGTFNGAPYIRRYYDISAENNGAAQVTLYYHEDDIADYNDHNDTFPDIDINASNLVITAFHSPANGGGSGPNGHSIENTEMIVPSSIVFNEDNLVWEVTFTTDSFSGFFAHTSSSTEPLHMKMDQIRAFHQEDHNVLVWNTLSEDNGNLFEITRSRDGNNFSTMATVKAKGTPSEYNFVDVSPYQGINYYRVVMVGNDGNRLISKIVSCTTEVDFGIVAYPNPTEKEIKLSISGTKGNNASVMITDFTGKVLEIIDAIDTDEYTISLDKYASGVYFIKYKDAIRQETIKVTKQ